MSKDVFGSDGLIARKSGRWAAHKLYYLQRYLDICSTGMSHKWPRRAFVDLMSGPGLCVVPKTGDEFDGSPLLAISTRKPLTELIFVERDERLVDALNKRLRARGADLTRVRVLPADCNDPKTIASIRASVQRSTLSLAFIDLLGFTVSFRTIEALTEGSIPMDLIFTFPEMTLFRNAQNALNGIDATGWTMFFGTDGWRAVVKACSQGGDRPFVAVKHELMRLYAQQLERLGYVVSLLPEPMRETRTQAPLYRPVFATRHPKGIEFWEKISAKDHLNRRRLF